MREILFRGMDTKGFWHYGLLAHINNSWFISNSVGIPTAYEVLQETIGVYTGLTDSNGNKIFEGDIVQCSDNHYEYSFIATVKFGNPNSQYNWGYQLVTDAKNVNKDILCWVEMEESGARIEVIDTEVDAKIRQNPELFEIKVEENVRM